MAERNGNYSGILKMKQYLIDSPNNLKVRYKEILNGFVKLILTITMIKILNIRFGKQRRS